MCVPILSGAEPFVLNDSSRCLSKEHSLYSCGSLVLHVWKHVTISVHVKAVLACPSCSETTFGDTPAANAIVAAEWSLSGIFGSSESRPRSRSRNFFVKY